MGKGDAVGVLDSQFEQFVGCQAGAKLLDALGSTIHRIGKLQKEAPADEKPEKAEKPAEAEPATNE